MPPFQLTSDDLLAFALSLATRWGVLKVPADRRVRVSNFRFRGGVPKGRHGFVAVEIAPGTGEHGSLKLEGNDFDFAGLSAEENIGNFIDWLQGQIEART